MADITERVHSGNITEISEKSTLRADFNKVAPRSVKDLAEKITYDLQEKIKTLKNANYSYDGQERKIRDLEHLAREFENFRKKEIPEGFELAPVLVNPRLSQRQLEATSNEYFDVVRTDFIKHVAEVEEDRLKETGVSKYAISLMKAGHILHAALPYNIDHIMERADSDLYSKEKALDTNNPRANNQAVLKINHFNNLILLPEKIHDYKNTLKKIQLELYSNEELPRYFIMLAPQKSDDDKRHYIAEPQKNSRTYSHRNLSDDEVIKETIKYLDTKSTKDLLNDEACLQGLNNVMEAMEEKISIAKESSDKRIAHTVTLDNLFKNEHLRNLYTKIDAAKHPIKAQFKGNIQEIRAIVYPNAPKKITAPSTSDVPQKKKVIIVKRKPSPNGL